MSKREHLKEHSFKPGQSGNPSGRPKTPDDILAARKHSREELERTILRLVWADEAAIKAEADASETPIIVRIIGKMAIKALKTQDVTRSSFLLDRAGFPVRKDENPLLALNLMQMPLDQLLALGQIAMKRLQPGEEDPNEIQA